MFKQGSEDRRGRVGLWVAGCLLGSVVSAAFPPSALAAPSEGELRAAVIVAIMRFTSWGSMSPERPALDVCLVGDPLSQKILMSISGEQKVASRTLNVRALRRTLDACQVVVIGENLSEIEYEALIAETNGSAILTVCDGCKRGLGEDAIIQLRLRQQRVSFEVNLSRAKTNGVALDAQLLELATVVRK